MDLTATEPITTIAWGFADRLNHFLNARGLDRKQLAAMTGIGRNTIGAYLNGQSTPKPDSPNMRVLAAALNVPLHLLANGSGDPEPPANMADRRSHQGNRASLCTASFANVDDFASPIAA